MTFLNLILAVLPVAAVARARTGPKTARRAAHMAEARPRVLALPRRDLRAVWSLDPATGRLVCRWSGDDAAPGARCAPAPTPRREAPLRLAA